MAVETNLMCPDIRQQQLDRLFQSSIAVELADWMLNEPKRTLEPRVLLRLSEPDELQQFAGFLRIAPRGNPSHTFGPGDYLLVFLPSGKQLELKHALEGVTLRAELLWRYDAPLADGPGLIHYLQLRNVNLPGYETVRSEPFPVDPDLLDWESPPDPPVDVVLHSLEHLKKTIPDPVELAESLLIWSAPGSEVWDRYPGSRAHIREMLQRLPPKVLDRALKNPKTLNGAQALAEGWSEMPAKLRRRIAP